MTKQLNLIAFVCAIVFSACVVIAHLINTELNWLSHTLSQYALGDKGLIITFGFYCIGLTQVLLAISFLSLRQKGISKGATLLFAAGIGVFIIALFPTQPPSVDILLRLPHIAGAISYFLLFPLAVLAISPGIKTAGLKKYSFVTGYACLVLFVLLLVLFIAKSWVDVPFFGLLEKLNILIINAWLIVFSMHINQRF
ncbi:MAG: hypothetical protein COB22_05630 [Cycloclasticus sp.]|nr:MAG: hypothetical protein COB22_05630 [Cycloclasticus sp.]